jgi:hypothetical protein
MSGEKLRCAISIAIFGVSLQPGLGTAQTQPTGIQENASATQSRSDATANSPATDAPRASSGASTWSAGQGSFGTAGRMSGVTNGAAGTAGGAAGGDTGQSSWVAGRGIFGSTAQSGGTWHESSGFSATTSSGSANKPANGAYVPAASPSFKFATPAFANRSASAQPAHAMASHASTSQHGGVGTRLGVAKVSRSNTAGRANTRPATAGLRSRTSTQSHSKTSIGSITKRSTVGPTTRIPSGFTPSSSTPVSGPPGAGTAPGAPPQ